MNEYDKDMFFILPITDSARTGEHLVKRADSATYDTYCGKRFVKYAVDDHIDADIVTSPCQQCWKNFKIAKQNLLKPKRRRRNETNNLHSARHPSR